MFVLKWLFFSKVLAVLDWELSTLGKKNSLVRPQILYTLALLKWNFFKYIFHYHFTVYVSFFEFLIKMIDAPRPAFTFSCTKNSSKSKYFSMDCDCGKRKKMKYIFLRSCIFVDRRFIFWHTGYLYRRPVDWYCLHVPGPPHTQTIRNAKVTPWPSAS
jgi:hypothetical protein